MEKIKPKVGDGFKGDLWSWTYDLGKSDGFSDSSFPGCQFRIEDSQNSPLRGIAVNIHVTGRPRWNGHGYESRVKIEFVGDGEPSTFTGGKLYHRNA